MLRTRVIPTLLLRNESLVKTRRFGRFTYVGDPSNTVRIFNELEVDELLFLDISATREGRRPAFHVLADIASECFMPLGYGGGIRNIEDADTILRMGFEKIVLNTYAVENPGFIRACANRFGSQAVIVSIDVDKTFFGNSRVFTRAGRKNTGLDPVSWAKTAVELGAGEILLTSIAREGAWSGFDIALIRSVVAAVDVPVIAQGGCGRVEHIVEAVKQGGASAVGVGSMVVFQKKEMGVLVNFPDHRHLETALQ